MKTSIFSFLPFLLVCLMPAAAFSQTTRPKLSPDHPTAIVKQWAWSEAGDLVLGIVIYAPTAKNFELGSLSGVEETANAIFTTKDSSLTVLPSQEVIQALQRYPQKPNFGRVKGVDTLEPGQMIEFTGAYPKPPLPPQKPDGKYEDYQFILTLPCNVPPVTFTIPCESPAVPPAP